MMGVYRFQGPDGKIHRVEAESAEAARAGLEDMWANRRPDDVRGFVQGAVKPLSRINEANPLNFIPGMNAGSENADRARDNILNWAAGDANVRPGKLGEFVGNMVGTAPTMALPGGAIVQGAVGGALLSDAKPTESPGKFGLDVALGGVGGKLGDMLGNAISTGAKNVTDPAVQLLEKAGVKMTPGQMLGGALKAWEDKATSQPFVGGAINKGRERALEGFNQAAYARALDPIGETISPGMRAGNDAVALMGDKISDAYDALIPGLKAVRDPQLDADLRGIAAVASNLPKDSAKQMAAILKNELGDRFNSAGEITGDALKQAQRMLAKRASQFRQGDPNQQLIAEGLDMGRQALLDAMERFNPAQREALRAADTAFANGLRVEKAASSVGAMGKEGRFTPQQLASAVKAADSSVRKKAVSRGEALMQDLAAAGQKVLQSSIPDSGTAGRVAILNPIALGMGGAGLAGYQGAKALAAALKRIPPGAAAKLQLLRAPLSQLGVVGSAQVAGE